MLGNDGIPRWWPTVVSALGLGIVVYAVVGNKTLPLEMYPVIALMIGGGPATWSDRILKRRNGNGKEEEH